MYLLNLVDKKKKKSNKIKRKEEKKNERFLVNTV